MTTPELKEYYVGVTMLNCFHIIAESEEHAEELVHEMDAFNLLDECDFNINYVDEVPQ